MYECMYMSVYVDKMGWLLGPHLGFLVKSSVLVSGLELRLRTQIHRDVSHVEKRSQVDRKRCSVSFCNKKLLKNPIAEKKVKYKK